MVLGKIILRQATIQSEGIRNIANELNISIAAGAKTSIILSHQYSGRDAASNPYRGKICVIEISIITDAVNQKASCRYLLPSSKTVELLSKRLVITTIIKIVQVAIMANERLRPSPTFSASSNC
jgi:subtilase family serine protease